MRRIEFFDGTLRDGSHAVRHKLSKETIASYCAAVDGSGLYAVIVGHGNGLGASSMQIGLSLLSDAEMLKTARENLSLTKLGAYLIPGFGTIACDIIPAIAAGVDVFKIGCHCTEADTTREHIEYLRGAGKEVYGVLMMYHQASYECLLQEAQKMQSYGANGVILMDSAGASTLEMVKHAVGILTDNLNIKTGFHAHNNLALACASAYVAVKEGAVIIDGTLRGFGAGAGNCPLEAIAALLQKSGYKLDVNLYKLFDVSEKIIKPLMPEDGGLSDLSIVSGMAGVFSAFKIPVLRAAGKYDVDARDIFMELGRRKVVAGQEDMIEEAAKYLHDKKEEDRISYEITSLL